MMVLMFDAVFAADGSIVLEYIDYNIMVMLNAVFGAVGNIIEYTYIICGCMYMCVYVDRISV